jgi:hypothetical protein
MMAAVAGVAGGICGGESRLNENLSENIWRKRYQWLSNNENNVEIMSAKSYLWRRK